MAKNRNKRQLQKIKDSSQGNNEKNIISNSPFNSYTGSKKNAVRSFSAQYRKVDRNAETTITNSKSSSNNNTKERVRNTVITKVKDKKKYRLKKYSTKYKIQCYEDKRKKDILKDFHKQTMYCDKIDVNKIYNKFDNQKSDEEVNWNLDGNRKEKRFDKFTKFKGIKEEKEQKKDAFLNNKLSNQKTLKEHSKEKVHKSKNFFKKSKKGQPIMKDRIKMLLEKVQKIN